MAKLNTYSIPFFGYIFSGTYGDIYAAAEGSYTGSGATFSVTADISGATMTFTDYTSASQTLAVGDAILAQFSSSIFTGYQKVIAAQAATWVI